MAVQVKRKRCGRVDGVLRRACGNGGKWSKDENLERDEFCTTHDTGVGREEEVVVVAGVRRSGI